VARAGLQQREARAHRVEAGRGGCEAWGCGSEWHAGIQRVEA